MHTSEPIDQLFTSTSSLMIVSISVRQLDKGYFQPIRKGTNQLVSISFSISF
jgi:hypothetical protein